MARLRSAGGDRSAPPAELPTDVDDREPNSDPETVARTICLKLLTMRARTRAELADALVARAVPQAASTAVLDRLTEVGLVDDAAFAAGFVSSRMHDRGLALREISRQLRDKGVDDPVIAATVASIEPADETDIARKLVARKLRSMTSLAPEVTTRRLVGMLARKGYSPGVAFRIVRDVIGAVDDESAADETHGSLDRVPERS